MREGSPVLDAGSAALAEAADDEEAASEEEDAAGDEAAASGCATKYVRNKTAATRSHHARLGSRSRRGGKADLLVDDTGDSMGS
jgi:hypothetical protein